MKVRALIREYGPADQVLKDLVDPQNRGHEWMAGQLLAAGQRVAKILSLPANPLSVAGKHVKCAGIAGLLRFGPSWELEIIPKFLGGNEIGWREDFLFLAMISRHGRILASDKITASVSERDDLAALVARAVVLMFWENHRRPLRAYRQTRVEEFAIDGDVEPESMVLPSEDGYSQRVVTFDRKNVFNSAILAATRSLLGEVRDPQIRRQLVRIGEVLAPQSILRRAQYLRVPSRAKRWQSLHDLCIDVLRGFGVSYDAAALRTPGYVIDTWRVWEDLLTMALRMAFGSKQVDIQRQVKLGVRSTINAMGEGPPKPVWVIPDLWLKGHGGLVVDAKYKGRIGDPKARIVEVDLYEALAFAEATKTRQVLLIYPAVARCDGIPETGTSTVFERVTVGPVSITGMEIEIRGISQRGAFRDFVERLRESCELLLDPPEASQLS